MPSLGGFGILIHSRIAVPQTRHLQDRHVHMDTRFVSSATRRETGVQSELVPFDHRRVVAGVCCLLGSRRHGREAQRR
jgi:hypothetical protein